MFNIFNPNASSEAEASARVAKANEIPMPEGEARGVDEIDFETACSAIEDAISGVRRAQKLTNLSLKGSRELFFAKQATDRHGAPLASARFFHEQAAYLSELTAKLSQATDNLQSALDYAKRAGARHAEAKAAR